MSDPIYSTFPTTVHGYVVNCKHESIILTSKFKTYVKNQYTFEKCQIIILKVNTNAFGEIKCLILRMTMLLIETCFLHYVVRL